MQDIGALFGKAADAWDKLEDDNNSESSAGIRGTAKTEVESVASAAVTPFQRTEI